MNLEERIHASGPKKILSIDGGGIRGVISIEVLRKIEALLREVCAGDNFVLADYFDYIAGNSTGAIIAAGLSLGWSVDKLGRFYLEQGKVMFDPANPFHRPRYRYEDEKLAEKLRTEFGADVTLGSDEVKTLLMLVMRNASTDSPWPVSNNPNAKYNDRRHSDCNLDLPLWQLVRASTAAPLFFPPEVVEIGAQEFVFVDGGVTPYNNPAFQAFIMATAEPYRLQWPTGEDKLLLVSVGTGTCPKPDATLDPSDMHHLYTLKSLPSALIYAALNEQDLLCRVFGKCLCGDPLDREVGNLIGTKGPVDPKLFTYLRYNAELTPEGLQRLGVRDIPPENVRRLDSVDHVKDLQRVGQAVANCVEKAHFKGFV